MIYSVKARYIEKKIGEFYQKLTDGTIQNQKPDGEEIVAAMRRAKITESNIIQWSEMCFCPTPLKHERETVYDHFLTDMEKKRAGTLTSIVNLHDSLSHYFPQKGNFIPTHQCSECGELTTHKICPVCQLLSELNLGIVKPSM